MGTYINSGEAQQHIERQHNISPILFKTEGEQQDDGGGSYMAAGESCDRRLAAMEQKDEIAEGA